MSVRINKLLADLGISSRRGADLLISAGKVKINGRKAKLGEKVDLNKDKLVVNGELINPAILQKLEGGANYEYWLLNKPPAVISAVSDPDQRQTVTHYLKNKTQTRLYPVGRLDYESEGLLLMTNDGELTHRLTH
ncbi:MAG TPA: pseudouridine synthase, partial [Candidatus Woesebacteria bacterium]|nr:pseudouridine synthase [Candidatus Woesebacteria bacterium]